MNSLNRTDSVQSGDLFVLWKTSSGDYRGLPATDLVTYLNSALTFPAAGDYTTQYASPALTGFNVDITDGAENNTDTHLILTPTGTLAAGTITLPINTGLSDKQRVLVNCTQEITALSIGLNGSTSVIGAPTKLDPGDFFTLKYDQPTNNWYRVG